MRHFLPYDLLRYRLKILKRCRKSASSPDLSRHVRKLGPFCSKWGDNFSRISGLVPFCRFCTHNSWIFLERKHRQHRIKCVRNSMYCVFSYTNKFGEYLQLPICRRFFDARFRPVAHTARKYITRVSSFARQTSWLINTDDNKEANKIYDKILCGPWFFSTSYGSFMSCLDELVHSMYCIPRFYRLNFHFIYYFLTCFIE